MYLSFECAALLYKNEAVEEIERDVRETLKQCITVTRELYRSQSLPVRMAGKVLRLLAPLM